MIVKIDTTPQPKYGKYFLSTEANDKEEFGLKPNTKLIKVKPVKSKVTFIEDDYSDAEEPVEDNYETDEVEEDNEEEYIKVRPTRSKVTFLDEPEEPVDNTEDEYTTTPPDDETVEEPSEEDNDDYTATPPDDGMEEQPVEDGNDEYTATPPEDETEQPEETSPEPNSNTKVIEIRPTKSRITFLDEPEEPVDNDGDDYTATPPEDETDEYTATPPEDGTGEQPPEEGGDDYTATPPDNGEDGQPTEDGNDEYTATPPDDGTGEQPPEEGGDDYTATPDDDGTGEQPADAGATQGSGPGLEYDSTRKYLLFENYISLSNALTNYLSKLKNAIGDDIEQNKVIRIAMNKLTEVKELCNDYMLMRFELSGYVQSLLFYQKLIVMIQLIFDMLKKNLKPKEELKSIN